MSLAQQLGFLYFPPLPIFFFEINILTGVGCLQNSSFWSTSHSRGVFCHRIRLPDARQITPQDNLQLTFIINPEISSAFKANDLHVQLFFLAPGSQFSLEDHKKMVKVSPGYSHDIQLRVMKYEDISGKTECVSSGTKGLLKFYDEYSYVMCVDECVAIREQNACGCNSLGFARPDDDIPNCRIFDMVYVHST